jgi:hypothetical protein
MRRLRDKPKAKKTSVTGNRERVERRTAKVKQRGEFKCATVNPKPLT